MKKTTSGQTKEYVVSEGRSILPSDYVRERYTQAYATGMDHRLQGWASRFYNYMPHGKMPSRWSGRLHAVKPQCKHQAYDKTEVVIGTGIARLAVLEELLRDRHQPYPTIIATLLEYGKSLELKHLEAVVQEYARQEVLASLQHAIEFSYGLLVPIFTLQEPTWRNALNNSGLITCLDLQQTLLQS